MSRELPAQLFHDPGYRIKKKNKDGSLNPEWFRLHGNNGKESTKKYGGPFMDSPSIRPDGMEGPEFDDYAWTADDF